MKRILLFGIALLFSAVPALAAEATFDRTLHVNGPVDLTVADGSGNIQITRGSDDQIHIFGRVHSGWGGSAQRVSQIAANPPIVQTGNIIRIGAEHMFLQNISIDYEIQAPAGSHLEASTGSGNLSVAGVGRDAHLSTGSGDIHAEGLQGAFIVGTGSGNIFAKQASEGDVKAETGSGDIELHDLRGALHANTGSGNIRVSGTPTSNWRLETGSGSIDFTPGASGFTIDASSGSGDIQTEQALELQGTVNRHHIIGKFHGGGPLVRIETGSGNIHIH